MPASDVSASPKRGIATNGYPSLPGSVFVSENYGGLAKELTRESRSVVRGSREGEEVKTETGMVARARRQGPFCWLGIGTEQQFCANFFGLLASSDIGRLLRQSLSIAIDLFTQPVIASTP